MSSEDIEESATSANEIEDSATSANEIDGVSTAISSSNTAEQSSSQATETAGEESQKPGTSEASSPCPPSESKSREKKSEFNFDVVTDQFLKLYNDQYGWAVVKSLFVFAFGLKLARECFGLEIMRVFHKSS